MEDGTHVFAYFIRTEALVKYFVLRGVYSRIFHKDYKEYIESAIVDNSYNKQIVKYFEDFKKGNNFKKR